ncbi:hypothetical protein [Fischerella thermalis]|uniref:hypothetical protein n=1 Tax=Fischerella thermalis TaxID=372787 RepID=UPI00241C700E|nr:hypothetical protein [Fischerella thermalis]
MCRRVVSQCGGLFPRHKGATAPLGVPRVVARGVTWRRRAHRLQGRGRASRKGGVWGE